MFATSHCANVGVLDFGVNTITGVMSGGSLLGGDLLDVVQFTKPSNVTISSIRIIVTSISNMTVPASITVIGGLPITFSSNGTFNVGLTGTGATTIISIASGTNVLNAGNFNYRVEILGTPEPASLSMLLLGGVGLAALKLRRRSS